MTQPIRKPSEPEDGRNLRAPDQPAFLRGMWYVAIPGRFLKRGKVVAKVLLGEPVLLGRRSDGQPFALRNICAHRGMPLDAGHFDGNEVECAYHGWRFGTDGVCTAIPALVEGQNVDVSKIGVRSYPCQEVQGIVWVFFGDTKEAPPAVPRVPGFEDGAPRLAQTRLFPVNIDHAVVGLIDPAHVPFVHKSSWYRPAGSMHEKSKRFVPIEHGFRMVRHTPSKNSLLYKLLGGAPATQIDFQLPGLRIEHIQAGRHSLVGFTAMTPTSEHECEAHHMIFWTMPWLSLGKPIAHWMARAFLEQDRRIVAEQHRGLQYDPQLMMIHDADTLARWYYQLKREFVAARQEGRTFVNSVPDRVLRWQT
jgi:phenylpropionate dioxygenase-like ring-hydroxylating dioxygenase large terminal subunit